MLACTKKTILHRGTMTFSKKASIHVPWGVEVGEKLPILGSLQAPLAHYQAS